METYTDKVIGSVSISYQRYVDSMGRTVVTCVIAKDGLVMGTGAGPDDQTAKEEAILDLPSTIGR